MDANQLTVETSNQQSMPVDEEALTNAARIVLQGHGVRSGELSIAIVDDPTIRSLNKQYLDHDYETDVISFVLNADESTDRLDGQLIVSVDTASREAREVGWSFEAELMLYVVHGTLHLVGYDDKTPASITEMRAAEANYMQQLGFPVLAQSTPQESDT